MPRLFKQTYTLKGVRKQSAKWYTEITTLDGRPRRVPLTRLKDGARRSADALIRALDAIRAGGVVHPESLPPIVQQPFLKCLEEVGHSVLGGARAASAPIEDHVDDYIDSLRASDRGDDHIRNTRREIKAVIEACGFKRLGDIGPEAVGRFIIELAGAKDGPGPRTRNAYLGSIQAFCRWCTKNPPPPKISRLPSNPLRGMVKANVESDRRRNRRALTPNEFQRLLDAARLRGLDRALTVSRGDRKGKRGANVSLAYQDELLRSGRARALMYKVMVLTGLRVDELRRLRWCDLSLDARHPSLSILGKNKKIQSVPLRSDLVADLKGWMEEAPPASVQDPVLPVPGQLSKRLAKDLDFAGIPKIDDAGRVVDVHALRHTCGVWLLQYRGATARECQEFMRLSSIALVDRYAESFRIVGGHAVTEAGPKLDRKNSSKKSEPASE